MIQYRICDFEKKDMYFRISADYVIQFENEEEVYSVSLPKKWIDILELKISIQEYDVYKIFFRTLKKENVSRITDYKKIWGLMKMNPGIKDDFYETASHKIYFGIDKVNALDFSYGEQIILCKPKNSFLNIDRVFSCVEKHYMGNADSMQILANEIISNENDLYVITWDVDEHINLKIHGEVENTFFYFDFEV